MRDHLSCEPSGSLALIDHVPITPLDPIAYRAVIERREGQGRRSIFRMASMPSTVARPENSGRRRSLALDRSEYDGSLMGNRDGGACATVPAIVTLLAACMIVTAFPFAAAAGERALDMPNDRATAASSTRDRSPDHLSMDVGDADPWGAHIAEAARRFAIPQRWIRAVMTVESAGDVRALSSAGAMGLMQIMPITWQELRMKHGLGNDPYDARANILAGAAYLREMHDRYGNVAAMLAAYNVGPGRYEKHLAGASLPAETVDYVARIMPMIDAGSAIPLSIRRQSNGSGNASAPVFAVTPDSSSGVRDVVDLSAFSPLSDGLFVSRPGVTAVEE